jgi:hypothetical protein
MTERVYAPAMLHDVGLTARYENSRLRLPQISAHTCTIGIPGWGDVMNSNWSIQPCSLTLGFPASSIGTESSSVRLSSSRRC